MAIGYYVHGEEENRLIRQIRNVRRYPEVVSPQSLVANQTVTTGESGSLTQAQMDRYANLANFTPDDTMFFGNWPPFDIISKIKSKKSKPIFIQIK